MAAELKLPHSHLLALAAEQFLRRHQNARLLADLDRAHADRPTAEEIEMRRAWEPQHRRRLAAEW